jgi:hypothetical protein
MNHQSVEFVVWLGIAVLALIWANLSLWRARRVLSDAHQDTDVQEIGLVPAVRVPSAVAQPASLVISP